MFLIKVLLFWSIFYIHFLIKIRHGISDQRSTILIKVLHRFSDQNTQSRYSHQTTGFVEHWCMDWVINHVLLPRHLIQHWLWPVHSLFAILSTLICGLVLYNISSKCWFYYNLAGYAGLGFKCWSNQHLAGHLGYMRLAPRIAVFRTPKILCHMVKHQHNKKDSKS